MGDTNEPLPAEPVDASPDTTLDADIVEIEAVDLDAPEEDYGPYEGENGGGGK